MRQLVEALRRGWSMCEQIVATGGCLIAVTLAVPSDGHAQKSGKWAEIGGWEVRVDPSVGNGCFAMQVYEDGTAVRIGVDVEQTRIYLFFANNSWKSLEVGKVYSVRVVFDGRSKYDGEMRGHKLAGGAIVLMHRNLSTDFVKDFMQRNSMRLYYQGTSIANLSLRNTFLAVAEVLSCQKEFGFKSNAPRNADPFPSNGGGGNRDPFR